MQEAFVRGELMQTHGALVQEALIRRAVMQTHGVVGAVDGALMHQALMGGTLTVIGGSSKEWSS